jgi:hypothetical protein
MLQLVDDVLSWLFELEWENLFPLAIGCAFFVAGRLARQNYKRLQQCGLPTQGVVLGIRGSGNNQRSVIRFVTQDLRWITEESPDSNYLEGDEVPILYNPLDPTDFVIGSVNESKHFHLLTLAGIVCAAYSVWMILNQ